MSTVASLNVNLGMSTADFAAGSKKAKKELGGLQSLFSGGGLAGFDISAMAGPAAIAVAGISKGAEALTAFASHAATAGMAIADMVGHQMEMIDNTAKMADRIGVSTEELTALHRGAEMGGADVEGLDTALKKLSVNIAKAAEAGEDDKIFKPLGLSAEELSKIPLTEALGKNLDAINALGSSSKKNAALLETMGKSAIDLQNMFSGGSAGIKAMQADADRLNLTFSRFDAAKVEEANDRIADVGKMLEGIKNRVAIEAAPAIAVLSEEIIKLAALGPYATKAISEGFGWVIWATAIELDHLQALGNVFDAVSLRITSGLASNTKAFLTLGKGAGTVSEMFGHKLDMSSLEKLSSTLDSTVSMLQRKMTGAANSDSWGKQFKTGIDDLNKRIAEGLKNSKDKIDISGAEVAAEIGNMVTKWQSELDLFKFEGRSKDIEKFRLSGASKDDLTHLEKMAAKLDKLDALKKSNTEWESKTASMLKDSVSAMDDYSARVQDLGKAWLEGKINAEQYWKLATDAQKKFDEASGVKALKDRAANRLKELQTPLQKLQDELAKIKEESAAGLLDSDQAKLAGLKANADFLGAQAGAADTGPQRPAALMAGTAAAFSASFGQLDSKTGNEKKLLQVNRDILATQKAIEAKLGVVHKL